MTTFASEIALIEADKEADKKYRELILEAENILVNMQKSEHSAMPIVPSPSRKFHNGLANKRVELIKNTELNIELALSRSRNSQPELQSGSIRDLEHTSPKRQFAQACSPIRRFMERNGPATTGFLPKENSYKQETTTIKYSTDSPIASRRTPPQYSPNRSDFPSPSPSPSSSPSPSPRLRAACASDTIERTGPRAAPSCCNGVILPSPDLNDSRGTVRSQIWFQNRTRDIALSQRDSPCDIRQELCVPRPSTKEEGVTSSSSDSEDRCDARRRAPLMTFRSVSRPRLTLLVHSGKLFRPLFIPFA